MHGSASDWKGAPFQPNRATTPINHAEMREMREMRSVLASDPISVDAIDDGVKPFITREAPSHTS